MTREEFLEISAEYDRQTMHHSFHGPMRKCSAYSQLTAGGMDSVRHIIDAFSQDPPALWGMAWVLVLMDITGASPVQPKTVCGGKVSAWNVHDTCRAWVGWGTENLMARP